MQQWRPNAAKNKINNTINKFTLFILWPWLLKPEISNNVSTATETAATNCHMEIKITFIKILCQRIEENNTITKYLENNENLKENNF